MVLFAILLVAAYRWIQIIPTLHIKDFFVGGKMCRFVEIFEHSVTKKLSLKRVIAYQSFLMLCIGAFLGWDMDILWTFASLSGALAGAGLGERALKVKVKQ